MSEQALRAAQRLHLVGIGGTGMAALASLLLDMGKQVSGSDLQAGPTLAALQARGAIIHQGHAAAHLGDAEYVIRSSAVPRDNPEVAEAARRHLPNKKLAEAVGELMRDAPGVAVAGSHGKTTTTALVAWLLDKGGTDPQALIGADTTSYPSGARLGSGPMVVEADEYDRRFLEYWPEVAVVTSIQPDHLDYFADLNEIRSVFQELVARLPPHGRLVVCADDPEARALHAPARCETYGFAACADWRITEYQVIVGRGSRFVLQAQGRTWPVESPLIGEHNACNAAAAIAVADYFGVGLSAALAALRSFQGVRRRFETRGRPRGIWLVDDYGHHPTEVAAVLRAARSVAEGELWIAFQPHTTNRTAALFDEFTRCFDAAQHALVLPIFRPSGRETAPRDVTSQALVEGMRRHGHPDARAPETFQQACDIIQAEARPGDLVLTMGAGDITSLSQMLLEALQA